MGEQTLWSWLKEQIGSVGFRLFLWSISMTEEQYLEERAASGDKSEGASE